VPELPEVEVTRRQIARLLVGRTIARVVTTEQSYFFLTRPALLKRRLRGRRVERLDRHGKYLIATIDDGQQLLLHLGMTGQLFTAGVASVRLLSSTRGASLTPERQLQAFTPDRHTHLQLHFEDAQSALFFRDARKFGKVQLLRGGEASKRLALLGVDALRVTPAHLFAETRRRRVPVKSVLLDQSVLAGVGNIYADEALYFSRIRPTRRANRLSRADCGRLVAAVKRVLRRSIETGGSSISDYVQPDGSDGEYQDERRVYDRAGEPCLRCRTPIRRIVIGQRSSHYCPRCQPR
jgi:formamidopyrimidine-DNA glycosylase